MAELIILEYKEATGQFHFNPMNNGIPHDKPGTFGWEPIAYVESPKASLFCDMIDCKLHRRKALKQAPYSAEYVIRTFSQCATNIPQAFIGRKRLRRLQNFRKFVGFGALTAIFANEGKNALLRIIGIDPKKASRFHIRLVPHGVRPIEAV